MRRRFRTLLRLVIGAALLLPAVFAAFPAQLPASARSLVQARVEPVTIPTYMIGPPDPNPIFFAGRAYQGAKGPVYPYALLDRITGVKSDRAYRALVLENEYLKITVLPELGGRVFEAVDKTNGYDFVYRQHVIKPALIGMLGAWISGGVEWNVPHHHRASTFMTVDSTIERQPDGSATVWVGEIELRHRMKWLVGLTLGPGRSTLEVTFKLLNRTSLPWSMLCFANVAVHANPDYQVLFPPSTDIATFHGKNQFSHWPISREIFNRQDYTAGVDVSWWKSHAGATSFFAFESEEDFLGGYDHGRGAGIAMVGDHNVVPGKKLWTWGTGSPGAIWEKILTDADGPYLELMVGSWSDNQPDYSWTRPGDVREVTEYWYPLRETGGLKAATRDAACNLEVRADGKARIAFNTTSARSDLRAVLRRASNTRAMCSMAGVKVAGWPSGYRTPLPRRPPRLGGSTRPAGTALRSGPRYTDARRQERRGRQMRAGDGRGRSGRPGLRRPAAAGATQSRRGWAWPSFACSPAPGPATGGCRWPPCSGSCQRWGLRPAVVGLHV